MEQPIVTVKTGLLKGSQEIDFKGRNYYSFRGIPYAKPPVGPLRFKAPVPAILWLGVRDATQHGSESGSKSVLFGKVMGSENCLFLNVYTPTLSSKSLKPVMCWIHGGGFVVGSGDSGIFGPQFLISEDIVLVSINYRLGLLGFLSFDDPKLDIPRNAGLKDQIMALKWIKENISCFGGDPNNVTIFGESSGGASVHLLILSPLAKGLFHRAIMQSGCALACWSLSKPTLPVLNTALKKDVNETEMLKILQNMSFDEIMKLQFSIPDAIKPWFQRPFGPVIESSASKTPFLLEDPIKIILSGNYNHVPTVFGFTSREGIIEPVFDQFFTSVPKSLTPMSDFEEDIPFTMRAVIGSKKSCAIAKKIKLFYFGDESVEENIVQYLLLKSDSSFVWPTYCAVRYHLTTATKPIYFYRFSIDARLNLTKTLTGNVTTGASHGDELSFLFKNSLMPSYGPFTQEHKAIKRMTRLWTNFSKNGNPNSIKNESLLNICWKPVEKNLLHYLDIGENLTVGINPEEIRMEFWDELSLFSSSVAKL